MVALISESGLIATTMALTATNDEASVSTFLFLCGSLSITVLCFIASLVGISHILRAASATTRRMAESVRSAVHASSVAARRSFSVAGPRPNRGSGFSFDGRRSFAGPRANRSSVVPIDARHSFAGPRRSKAGDFPIDGCRSSAAPKEDDSVGAEVPPTVTDD